MTATEATSTEKLPTEDLAKLLLSSGFHTKTEADADRLLAELKAKWLREVADTCDEAGGGYTARALNEHAAAAFDLMEHFQRQANEVQYAATPCSFVACEPGGEPCDTHERLMGHFEGDHDLCGPECRTPAFTPPAGA